jgi:hypothetical protein
MTQVHLSHLSKNLPYPIGLKLQVVSVAARSRSNGGKASDLPFAIASFASLVLRLCAIISIDKYVRMGAKDNEINHFLVDRLRAPADGTWREVTLRLREKVRHDPHARRVHSWFDADGNVPTGGLGWDMPRLCVSPRFQRIFDEPASAPAEGKARDKTRLESKPLPKASKVDRALEELVNMRNKLVHGEPPDEEGLDLALLRVEAVARGAALALAGAILQVRDGNRGWRLMGHVPQPLDDVWAGLEDRVPTFVFADGTEPLPLAPLLHFRPKTAELAVGMDELYFVNAAALERLHYVGFRDGAQADGKQLGTYDAFCTFWQRIPVMPSPKDPVLAFDDLAAYHAQLFVGRGEVLDEIAANLARVGEPGRYLELRALAGMGKSAILAMLYVRQRPILSPKSSMPQTSLLRAALAPPLPGAWAFHFCARTEGREYALVALRSVVAQLCDQAGLDRSQFLSNEINELREQFLPTLLEQVASKLGAVVVVLDALDESAGSDDDALGGCLPERLPAGVTVVVSWRVDAQNRASRVDRQLKRIPFDYRLRLPHADPLNGLPREHVGQFLNRLATADLSGTCAVVPPSTVDAVWAAATMDSVGADPFFLRFVAEGTRDGRVDLARSETIPASLDDAFEGEWLTLPTDGDFLAQRILLTLGILREYGDDALLQQLISLDPAYGSSLGRQDIAVARQCLGKLLVYEGERYGLFHDRFRSFLVGDKKDPIAEALGES